MGLSSILILSQLAGYFVILILSLCIFLPIFLQMQDFNGQCLLFANGTWREDDGLFEINWSSKLFCNLPFGTGVLLFFFSIFQIYRYSNQVYKHNETSFACLFLDVVLGITMFFLIVISASLITIGFIYWCSAITERFPSCAIAAGQNITRSNEKVDTSRFYIEMGTAQFGAWGSFAVIAGILVISFLKLISNHETTNIRVSMYLERQRLVNENSNSEPMEGQRSEN